MDNHKRVGRIHTGKSSAVRTMKRRKRVGAVRMIRRKPTTANMQRSMSMHLVSNVLHDEHGFRVLTFLDHLPRETPAIEVEPSLTGKQVVEVLEAWHLRPDWPSSSRPTTSQSLVDAP